MTRSTAAAHTSESADMNRKDIQGFEIKNRSALLIGCGGLGCSIAVHLVGAGIGKLTLCDFDTVSESNLNRQFLYTKEDIGKEKTIAAKARLQAYSDDSEITAVSEKIEDLSDLEKAGKADIVFSAVDNAETRKLIMEYALRHSVPCVFGVIDGFYGMSYLFIPGITPCIHCAALCEKVGIRSSVSPTAGIIGSCEAALGIEYLITNNSSLGGKLLVYDSGSFDTLPINPSENCEICKNL